MTDNDHIQLAHGGGGQLMAELIEQVILPSLGPAAVAQATAALTDAAAIDLAGGRWAFTTDSYVVQPLEFPGGDIGKLAICGTVNDLAVSGAAPRALTLALVIEEGTEIALLRRVLESAGRTAAAAGVAIVTGDTKVVERGGLNGMVLNTAGIGAVLPRAYLGFDRVQEGDAILISGPLGEHGLAVMSRRKNLSLATTLSSDCAPLHELTAALIDVLGPDVHFMRDPTRGGLAATLAEVSAAAHRDILIQEAAIPVNRTARAAAEMLGLDLLNAANEGKLLAVVSHSAAAEAAAILRRFAIASQAAVIGEVGSAAPNALVEMATLIGGRRVVQMPYGEELPRIC